MTKQVNWTKIIIDTFMDESGITQRIEMGDDHARILEGILRTRAAGWSIQKQAHEFHLSTRTVDNYVKELKHLYDETQKHSIILPKRKTSKKELEMDNS